MNPSFIFCIAWVPQALGAMCQELPLIAIRVRQDDHAAEGVEA